MTAPQLLRTAALSLLALAGITSAGLAASLTAETNTTANLRQGPGTSYAVIDSLPDGTEVEVSACTAYWCAVTTDEGEDGFIARSLLDVTGMAGNGGNGGGKIILTPTPPPPPPGMSNGGGDGEVCFYQQQNYKGANFCVEPGDEDAQIPGSFDDAIQSIRVNGDAVVEVCADPDYETCATYDHSMNKLPLFLAGEISSYTVDTGDNGIPDLPPTDNPDGAIITLQ